MSKWHCLTPMNGTASDGWHKLIWWDDPVAALNVRKKGHLEPPLRRLSSERTLPGARVSPLVASERTPR